MDQNISQQTRADHQQAATSFIARDDLYRHLFLNMRCGFAFCEVILDQAGRYTDFIHQDANTSYERLTGLHNVIGLKASEAFPDIEHSHPGFIKKLLRVAETGIPDRFEFSFAALHKLFDISVYSWRKEYFTVIIDDITEHKVANETLKESEEQFRKLFENHSASMLVIDPKSGNIIRANPAAADFYGWSLAELCGMNINQINSLSPAKVKSEMKKSLLGKKNFFSFKHRKANGSIKDVEVFSNNVVIKGKPLLYSIINDVTERKQAEAELQRLSRSLKAINICNNALLHTTDEIKLLQQICNIVVNEGEYRMAWVGYAEHDKEKSIYPVAEAGFVGNYLKMPQISWADIPQGSGPKGRAIRTGNPCLVKNILNDPLFELWRLDAIHHGFASILSLPLKSKNEVFGALTIYAAKPDAFDAEETTLLKSLADNLAFGITMLRNRKAGEKAEKEHKKIQKQLLHSEKIEATRLRRAKKQALDLAGKMTIALREREKQLEESLASERKAGEQQRSFQSMISHEYRTPLSIISYNLDIMALCGKDLSCVHTVELEKMKRAVKRLVEIMEVSIEQSHSVDSAANTSSQRIEISPFLFSQLANTQALWPGRYFQSIDGDLEGYDVIADRQSLKTAFINLLDNARKYSPQDSPIEVACQKEAEQLVMRITNKSTVISSFNAEDLFKKYERGANSSNTSGAGIGLWLVRQIIEQHNGSITLESNPPDVITTVRIPLADDALGLQ